MLNKKFTYGSVCSGIEAVTVGWHKFATPLWFSEIENYPSQVLAHHYPDVPNLGDMLLLKDKVLSGEIAAPDVLVGGTPCQAFSVAGERRSLDDERGALSLAFVELADAIDEVRRKNGQEPCIILWENVPGVLSTKDNAFGCFIGGLSKAESELKPTGKRWTNAGAVFGQRDVYWRILDSQYFGVPQRRRRVFVIASARKQNLAEIFFECESGTGHTQSSGETQQDITACTGNGVTGHSCDVAGVSTSTYANVSFGEYKPTAVSPTLKASGSELHGGGETLVLYDFSHRCDVIREYDKAPTLAARAGTGGGNLPCCLATERGEPVVVHGTQDPIVSDKAHCLGRNNGQENAVFAISGNIIGRTTENGGNGIGVSENTMYTLTATDRHVVATNISVRKLTPVECERLQGFPDNYTLIPYNGKPAESCPDGHRYKALGNSMTVNVMRALGIMIYKMLY